VDRGGEALDLLFVEVARERIRRELRGVEDLVRPGAADPGDEALVAEERVQAARVRAEDLGELLPRRAVRLRAEVPELARASRREQPDAGALLLRVLGEDELRAAVELERERGAWPAFSRGEVLEPPAVMRWTRRTSSPSSVGKRSRFRAPLRAAERRPSSAAAAGRTS
jgi:hypothetical protein